MAPPEETDNRKAHQAPHSGRKAEKKDAKRKKHLDDPASARQRNPKAFALQHPRKTDRLIRRTLDIKSKGYHIPEVDKTPERPPPAVVAVIGPPKVGKTTLLRCLIRNFTRQKLTSINGPVTVITGKKKRVTFIECDSDINKMIDIAKIADLVLMLIDAKSGFEMDTFEFMNICQVHGMPRMMGVLTHLDLFQNKKCLQRTKTILKKRYQTEIPRGEKMFYLSGILHGEYLRNEVHNLGRFIAVMKFEPSVWKKTHPYVFVDRVEDVTDPEILAKAPESNRKICLYGYARGGALKRNAHYHIPGCGDYFIKNIHFLPDPCPLPDKKKKRSLNEKERLLYAPMSGVGGIVYDKDAVYIEMDQEKEQEETQTDKLVSSMASIQHPIDEKMRASSFHLFLKDGPVDNEETSSSEEEEPDNVGFDSGGSEDELDDDEDMESENESLDNGATKERKRKVTFADEDEVYSHSNDDDDASLSQSSSKPNKKKAKFDSSEKGIDLNLDQAKWKENLVSRAASDFYQRQKESFNLQKLVYGTSNLDKGNEAVDSDSDEEIGGLFRIAKYEKEKKNSASDNGFDASMFTNDVRRDWSNETELQTIQDCFVTGKWAESEDAETLLKNDDELYGDFEDLENGISYKGKEKEENDPSVKEDLEENDAAKPIVEIKPKTRSERRLEKKKKLKELFNKHFDEAEQRSYHDDLKMEADAQGELNKAEFEGMDEDLRVQYEGFRHGLYLRLEIENMPCEFVNHFDPSYPVIVGSLLKGEDKMGYLQVRIKKHRWYPRILKTRDPLIFSLGWRRFQTTPLYYIVDPNIRNRHLKYTPNHLHCMAAIWGPITQQKSGFVCVQTVSQITSNFRIAAIGSVMEVNQVTDIVKKLKLLGTPYEIFSKSAFVKGMFHSPLEATKYEGAAIRTVSGIRGQIKKALRVPPGVFRATFEDKIVKSDLVFLRTWVKVIVPKFCITVSSLLMPRGEKNKWEGARTLGKMRFDLDLHAPFKEDSLYTPIERKIKQFAPLVVSKNLQKALPFKDKIIHKLKTKRNPENERIAVIKEPKEREISKVIGMLKKVHQAKVKTEKKAMWQRAHAHHKEKKKEESEKYKRLQEKKKLAMSRRPNRAPKM